MKTIILFLLLSFVELYSIQSRFDMFKGGYSIFLRSGQRKGEFLFCFDTTSQNSFAELVTDIEGPPFIVVNNIPFGGEVNEFFYFGEKYEFPIPNMTLFVKNIFNHENETFINKIGLGKSINKKQSIVHILLENNIIQTPKFSFVKTAPSKGIVIFGDVPATYLTQFPNKNELDAFIKDFYWGFKVNYVEVNGKRYEIPKVARHYFSTSSQHIKVSIELFSFIEDEYFKELSAEGKCHVSWEIICECKSLGSLKNMILTFNINDVNYSFDFEGLFYPLENGQDCLFIIAKSWKNDWEFGTGFLDKFLVTFDYNTERVTIYSRNESDSGKKTIVNNYKNYLMLLVLLTFFLGGILLIFFKKNISTNETYRKI